MQCIGLTICSECGTVLKDYEYGTCENCSKKIINSKNCGNGYIKKKTAAEAIGKCYIDKTKIRKIVERYSIRKKDGKMFFDFNYAPDFCIEILELVGYREIRRIR